LDKKPITNGRIIWSFGDGCRTGIHTCLSPGVKIGAGSFINSMTMVTHDIADKSFVKMKMVKELDIRPNTKEVSDAGKRKHFRKKLS
jgi:UDP-3-O-[3-hydroxymyristoyl] glucosamine N-acyltransferase